LLVAVVVVQREAVEAVQAATEQPVVLQLLLELQLPLLLAVVELGGIGRLLLPLVAMEAILYLVLLLLLAVVWVVVEARVKQAKLEVLVVAEKGMEELRQMVVLALLDKEILVEHLLETTVLVVVAQEPLAPMHQAQQLLVVSV